MPPFKQEVELNEPDIDMLDGSKQVSSRSNINIIGSDHQYH